MTDSCWPQGLPREFALVAFTTEYPLEDEIAAQKGMWSSFKRVLGKGKPHAPRRPRQEWFTAYEEPGKGFVLFQAKEIRRIIMIEHEDDLEDLADTRSLLEMLNQVHVVLNGLKDKDTAEFYERFLKEARQILAHEPMSRRPATFIQDVFSADARLNGIFYQALCSVYSEIYRLFRKLQPEEEQQLAEAQDKVIALWKQKERPPVIAWKDLMATGVEYLELAREWAKKHPKARKQPKKAEPVNDISSVFQEQ